MWECAYTDCVPIAFDGRAGLEWTHPPSCLRVCWQPSPWQGVGLEIEGLELELSVRGNSALLSGCHLPVRGRVWSQETGAAALRFGLTYPLSVCFPLCPEQGHAEAYGAPMGFWLMSGGDRGPGCLWCTIWAGTCSFLSLHWDAALDTGVPCPSPPVTAPSPCCPCPVVVPHSRAV